MVFPNTTSHSELFTQTEEKTPNTPQHKPIIQSCLIGWEEYRYTHLCLFHLDIIDGKVWVQENRTEVLIGEELVELGIPKHDIVPGLLHPEERIDTEYAAA